MVENRFTRFGHVERKPVNVNFVVSRVDHMDDSQITRGRGIPRNSIRETIRKDSKIELDPNMAHDRTLWCNVIHVADPT